MFLSHNPSLNKSSTRYLFTQIKLPERTFLTYILLLIGSKHSLFYRIWEVLAVGINEVSSELYIPNCLISFLRTSKSRVVSIFLPRNCSHKSIYNSPCENGLPTNVLYAPYCFAISIDFLIDAK